jgi:hypothetical protein
LPYSFASKCSLLERIYNPSTNNQIVAGTKWPPTNFGWMNVQIKVQKGPELGTVTEKSN